MIFQPDIQAVLEIMKIDDHAIIDVDVKFQKVYIIAIKSMKRPVGSGYLQENGCSMVEAS